MTKQRSKGQIIAQILDLCQEDGASKTRLVYGSGLNFIPGHIRKGGLVEIVPGSYPLYRITQRCEDALFHLRALEELIPEFATVQI